MLYSSKFGLNKVFYFVLYGSFSLLADNGSKAFGQLCTHGFTIGEEVLFEPILNKRIESAKATQTSCCIRIDLEKFRNMSDTS